MLIDIYDEDGKVIKSVNSKLVWEVKAVQAMMCSATPGMLYGYGFRIISLNPNNDMRCIYETEEEANESRARFISYFKEAENKIPNVNISDGWGEMPKSTPIIKRK